MHHVTLNLFVCSILAFFFAWLIKQPSLRLLSLSGLVTQNYVGKSIPTSVGVIFVLSAFSAAAITMTSGELTASDVKEISSCAVLIVGASLVGLIDDVFGSHLTRGFLGHVTAFIKRRQITTGLLKAVIIWLLGVSAIIIAREIRSPLTAIFDATLISLAANFINLLDLQPARAIKGYFMGMALLLACDCHSSAGLVPMGLAGAALSGIRDELHELSMIGDAGSNALGAALGYWVTLRLSPVMKAPVLLFLVGVHVYSHRCSLSETIESNSVLRFIDRLGRS